MSREWGQVNLNRSSSLNLNISQARIIRHVWESLSDQFLEKKLITRAQLEKIKKNYYCFKISSDLVDTELTHFANTGWISQNQYYPMICVTCDENIEKIKFRLGMYKFLINKYDEYLTETNLTEPQRLDFKPGMVIVCDKNSGEIKEIIDINELDIIL